MSHDYVRPQRDWREIAAEAMRETDPKKRSQLAKELERALDEKDKAIRQRNQSWKDRGPSGPS